MEDEKIPNVVLSKYQLKALRNLSRRVISDQRARYYKQVTMNSLANHEVMVKIPGGYAINEKGLKYLEWYDTAEVEKENPSKQLGKYVMMLKTLRGTRRK